MGLWAGGDLASSLVEVNNASGRSKESAGPEDEENDIKWILEQIPDLGYLISQKVELPAEIFEDE